MYSKYPSIDQPSPRWIPPTGWALTVKRDGENSSLYCDGYFHIRSLDSTRPSKDPRAKTWALTICPFLKEAGYHRLVFENCYDCHSIHYSKAAGNALDSYYQTILITKMVGGEEIVIPIRESIKFCVSHHMGHVPLIGYADGSKDLLHYSKCINTEMEEGIVVRNPSSFPLEDLGSNSAKWVRTNHVQTDDHWTMEDLPPNEVEYKSNKLIEGYSHAS